MIFFGRNKKASHEVDLSWLVADLHARNFVRDQHDVLRVIDLVAGPWPIDFELDDPSIRNWVDRVRIDPSASALPGARDEEL